jgi:GT2 family glycosyltransferase
MKKSLVSIIIPTYNRKEKLIRCLDSIFNNTYKNIEVIVINDAPDDDLSFLNKKFKIRIIQHKKGKYCVKSRNEGAKVAKGEILFFVDDDNILDKFCISKLVSKYIGLQKIGLLGPLMYKTNNELWFYGGKVNWINPNVKPVPINELKNELIETDAIPNANMISKSLYFKIGMEDPNFHTHEELDLTQRLKQAGYKSYIYTKAKTIHDIGTNTVNLINRPPNRMYYTVLCNIKIERKYAPLSRYILFILIFMPVHFIIYNFYYIPFKSKNKIEYYKAYLMGLHDVFFAKSR